MGSANRSPFGWIASVGCVFFCLHLLAPRLAVCSNHRLRPMDGLGDQWPPAGQWRSLYADPYASNSVLDFSAPSATPLLSKMALSGVTCRHFPGLSKKQLELCYRYPDVMEAAVQGLQIAVRECQFQFQKHRWNCSVLETKNRNPHSSIFLQKGYRETAFAYAVSSAGVAHAVSRACGLGQLDSCSCGGPWRRRRAQRPATRDDWRWGGCSQGADFGVKFSRFLLDTKKERSQDIHARIHLHNSQVGREVVASSMEVRCKCHGMSGSCEMKTCWKAAPDFRRIGTVLKQRFDRAVLVDQSQIGNRVSSPNRRRMARGRRFVARTGDLLFYERSPNFCERRQDVGHPGVSGRRCNRTGDDYDNCQSLCCGRGYNTVRQRRVERCHCRFHWCCSVVCQNCTVEQWVTVCK